VSNFYSPIQSSESRQRERREFFLNETKTFAFLQRLQLRPPVEADLPASVGLAGGQQSRLFTASNTTLGRTTEQGHTDDMLVLLRYFARAVTVAILF